MRALLAVMLAVVLLQVATIALLSTDNDRLRSALAARGEQVSAVWRRDAIFCARVAP